MNKTAFIFTFHSLRIIFSPIKKWANKNHYHRLLTIMAVSLLIIGLARGTFELANYFHLNEIKEEYKDKSETLILGAKARLDEFNLCVDSTKNKSPNADFYCNKAIENFKNTSWKIISNEQLDEYKDKKAYELIVLNLKHAVRFFELPKTHEPASISAMISSELGIFILTMIEVFLLFAFPIYIFWPSKEHHNKTVEKKFRTNIQQRLQRSDLNYSLIQQEKKLDHIKPST